MKRYRNNLNQCLKTFNTHNDVLGGCHPGLTGIPAFRNTYYAHVHALNVTGETDSVYTVSGLDASETPVQIVWEYHGGDKELMICSLKFTLQVIKYKTYTNDYCYSFITS